jgi:uncharacterized protein (DUF1501 family)
VSAALSFPDNNLGAVYPAGGLSTSLKRAQKLCLADDINPSIISCSFGGNDTHDNQRNRNNGIMSGLNGSIEAFLQGMRSHNLMQDTIVVVYCEFGRQVKENSTSGTDHARASDCYIFGDGITGGIYGPSYSDQEFVAFNQIPPQVEIDNLIGQLGIWLGLGVSQVADLFPKFNQTDYNAIKFI